jgi:hypothetical protein
MARRNPSPRFGWNAERIAGLRRLYQVESRNLKTYARWNDLIQGYILEPDSTYVAEYDYHTGRVIAFQKVS